MRECRILIVDPFTDFAHALADNLSALRRTVDVVPDPDQAKRLARPVSIDLAIVEQRLQSPGDPFDTSGVALGGWLKANKGTYVVLLSGQRPRNGQVDSWIRNQAIDEYQLKTTRADERHQRLEQILTNEIGVNFDLDILWEGKPITDDHWRRLALGVEMPDGDEGPGLDWHELEQLFYRLFPKKYVRRVEIRPVPAGMGGAGLVFAEVVHAGTQLVENVIVKYGHCRTVRTEDDKFERYVAPLGPRGIAPRRWSTQWRELAAIAYWVVQSGPGRNCPALGAYLQRPDCNRKDEVFLIEALFFEIFGPWYDAFRRSAASPEAVRDDTPLVIHWVEHLWAHRSRTEALQKLEHLPDAMRDCGVAGDDGDHVSADIGGRRVKVRNPVQFIQKQAADAGPPVGALCLVHGDLHPRNVFVLGKDPCVIDFADVHAGHPFRDFASLEASLRFCALYDFARHPETTFWSVEQDLLASLFSPRWTAVGAASPALDQAVRLTHEIRGRARWLSDYVPEWEAQYALGLLFCLLKIAGVRQVSGSEREDHTKQRRKLAFLAAGALVDRCAPLFNGPLSPPSSGRVAPRHDAHV